MIELIRHTRKKNQDPIALDWILFFDEADAIFGKRSNVNNAHDKYANREVSCLLQRIEDFKGLVILASISKNNFDKAFVRRFNAIIHFPMPSATERQQLWEEIIPTSAKLEKGLDTRSIAEKYELRGSSIVQTVHYASLRAFSQKGNCLTSKDILQGIRQEFEKGERVFK